MTAETTLMDDLVGGCPRPVRRCKVGAILDQLDNLTSSHLVAALDGPDWSDAAGVLAKHGHRVGESVLRRHRLSICACTT